MAIPKTLRVRAHGDALVHNYERAAVGTLSFVGREYKEVEGGGYAFVPTTTDTEVPCRVEYVRALQSGDLEPADEATAKAAGLPWSTLEVNEVKP